MVEHNLVSGLNKETTETELGKVSSAKMANRLLDEIAIKGGFSPQSTKDGFVIYVRVKDGSQEELTIKKRSDRVYTIVQRTVKEETMR